MIKTLKLWSGPSLSKCFKTKEEHADTKGSVLLPQRARSGFWSLNSGHHHTEQAVSLGAEIMTWRVFVVGMLCSPPTLHPKEVYRRRSIQSARKIKITHPKTRKTLFLSENLSSLPPPTPTPRSIQFSHFFTVRVSL